MIRPAVAGYAGASRSSSVMVASSSVTSEAVSMAGGSPTGVLGNLGSGLGEVRPSVAGELIGGGL